MLVVDVQNDFCSPEGLSAQRDGTLEQIAEMIPRLSTFVATLKSHGVFVIYTQMVTKKNPPANYLYTRSEKGFEDMVLEGTSGADFYLVTPEQNDRVVVKERFDAFAGTNLKDILSERNIRNIIVTGVRSDICVDATAKRAFAEDYNVFVVKDLVATSDERTNQQEVILETFGTYSGFVLSSQEVLEILK